SEGGRIFSVKITCAEGSSARTAVTVNGSGPGPVLVTLIVAWPEPLVMLLGALNCAPPVANQLMVTPEALLPLSCASTTRGEASGAFGAAVWLSPLAMVT